MVRVLAWMAVAITAVLVSIPAFAADITVHTYNGTNETYIIYSGETTEGDADKMMAAVNNAHNQGKFTGYVYLQGPGGLASEGEAVGNYLRRIGATTVVFKGAKCISACTSIWLSGKERILFEGGELWFHLPYIPQESSFVSHPYEGAKNNYGWQAVIDYHNEMILKSLVFDISKGIINPSQYINQMSETGPDKFYKVTTKWDLERVLGGRWIPAQQ